MHFRERMDENGSLIRQAPARVRSVRETTAQGAPAEAVTFSAEISNVGLDTYFSHMDDLTLRNFAREAAAGVPLLDSHNSRNLGYGRSFDGRREGEAVSADFFTVPGINFGGAALTYASTDDFIRALDSRLLRDVSVGFYGGSEICDICGGAVWDWRGDCIHLPGLSYAVGEQGLATLLATYTVSDAHLAEVSVVFSGATPGAELRDKIGRMAEAGRLMPEQARVLESRYRMQLPEAKRAWAVGGAVVLPPAAAKGADVDDTQLRSLLSVGEDADLLEEVRALVDEAARLRPLADAGRQYRADLIAEALAEGVRAMGQAFPSETYRAMLDSAELTAIKSLRDSWRTLASERLPGGRLSVDGTERERPSANFVPDAAYHS